MSRKNTKYSMYAGEKLLIMEYLLKDRGEEISKLSELLGCLSNASAALPDQIGNPERTVVKEKEKNVTRAEAVPADREQWARGLRVLAPDAPANRLALARWLTRSDHPLTARVTVNRYWQMYFGTGLVKTAENFGTQGERPSHPALLDWLATEFVRHGWSIKETVRRIVTSATYRQSPRVTPTLLK
ncbi:DUF1553 domain-containing protein [candidate division KSB1 bacterium]|nr:DUF1553 domain-containing protein [candidate division KSB1 bacterium]